MKYNFSVSKYIPFILVPNLAYQAYNFLYNDSKVRVSYNQAITKEFKDNFVRKAFETHSSEQSLSELTAKEASMVRHEIKVDHQSKTSFIGQAIIYARNLYQYGNTQGPSFEKLIAKKNAEDLFYSTFRTDGGDLGLQGNNMGKYIKLAKQSVSANEQGEEYTHYNDLYPEHFLLYDIMKQDGEQEVVRILGEKNFSEFTDYLPYIEAQLGA